MDKVFLSPASFAGASLAGALLLAVYIGSVATDEGEPQVVPDRPAATQAEEVVQSVPATTEAAAAQPVAVASSCPTQALAPARGEDDGRFTLQAALASGATIEPRAFLVVARESAQEGRLRDAEVAMLAACHVAERSAGRQSVPLADLKSEMGQQYVTLAAQDASEESRAALLQRAAALYSESAAAYAAALGRHASKTRIAQQRLASLNDPAALQLAGDVPPAQSPTATMGAARPSADSAPRPARGAAARLIRQDPELAQLESDMQRLHAQASKVARDPGGLRQRDRQALAQRDAACQDKACLLRWYAQRRSQLLGEF